MKTIVTEKYDEQGNLVERVTTTEHEDMGDLLSELRKMNERVVQPFILYPPTTVPLMPCYPSTEPFKITCTTSDAVPAPTSGCFLTAEVRFDG